MSTETETIKLPSIYEAQGRHAIKIGCHLTAKGKRTRSYHWLAPVRKVALVEAMKIEADWETNLPAYKKWLSENLGALKELEPESEWSKPIWVSGPFSDWVQKFEVRRKTAAKQIAVVIDEFKSNTMQAAQQISAEVLKDTIESFPELQTPATPPAPLSLSGPSPTIEQVRDQFLAYKGQKVGGHRHRGGIEQTTHQNLSNHMKGIFRHFSLVGLSPNDPISRLDGPTLERLIDGVYRKVGDGDLAERTAAHYCASLKQLVEWAHRQSGINYRLPDNADDILHISVSKKTNVRPYDPNLIKLLLKRMKDKGDEKTALCVLLALVTGAYENDIANWGYQRQEDDDPEPYDNLVTDNGDTYVWWRREKTRNKNSFFSLHLLPSEVVALLGKHLRPNDKSKNPHLRLLLSDNATPLYTVCEGGRSDCIGRQYRRAKSEVEEAMRKQIADPAEAKKFSIDYPFMQLRKDCMNFVYQTSKSTDLAQKFGGQVNDQRRNQERADDMKRQFSGSSKPGVLSDF